MQDPAATIIDVFEDEHFFALLRRSQRETMTWDAFLEHPLPQNMSPLSAWRILSSIGKCTGVALLPAENDEVYWYRRTDDLVRVAEEIRYRCLRGLPSQEKLADHIDQVFVLGLRLDECVAAAQLGNITFDGEKVEMCVRSTVSPDEGIERLLYNQVIIDSDLNSYIAAPFSDALFTELRARLLEGINEQENKAFLEDGEPIDEDSWRTLTRHLENLYHYANCENDVPEDFKVLRGSVIADSIRRLRPYGVLSTLLGSLAARLFYLKNGLGILGIVPISASKLHWLEGNLSEPHNFCTVEEYESTLRRSPYDMTVHQVISAHCILAELEAIESQLEDVVDQDQAIREALGVYPQFNSRQRSILARAIRTSDAEFSIRYHQKKHGIAYATARRDLLELEEAGFLRIEQRGKVFIFKRDTRIGDIVAKQY